MVGSDTEKVLLMNQDTMDNLILAIDQGTGGTKTVLFNAQGEVVGQAAVSLRSVYP